mgnify:CR=1 FL=1
MKNLTFKNKTVLITGASSGIGKEFAHQLASQSANLIITSRTNSVLVELAKILQSENPSIWVKTIGVDLSESDGARLLFSKVDDMGLSVDFLINNAGFGKFCEFSGETFLSYHKMMMLNMNALVELTHLFLPYMKEKNSGGVINVGSTGSFQPLPYQAVYGACKAFVLNFSEALSGELLDTNIRVMALCPGVTESNFMKRANADTSEMKFSSTEKVVNTALSAYGKNRVYVVSGCVNYLTSLIPRFVSRKRAVKIVANMFKNSVLNNKVLRKREIRGRTLLQ